MMKNAMPLQVGKSRLKIESVYTDLPVYERMAIRTPIIVKHIPIHEPKMKESEVELSTFLASYRSRSLFFFVDPGVCFT